MSWASTICTILKRKKVIDPETVATETGLARVLSTLDLTALGVGSTLGVGVYVLAGHVARDNAGPAVILSFIFAGIASIFAGLCYAEFGARAPKAGSAYIYSYVTVGEFIAFVIGWNLILEYVIGAASVSRGLSLYLDKALNDTMKDWYIKHIPIYNVNFLADYFDLLGFAVPILLSLALAYGVKQSSRVNAVCTGVNLIVVIFVLIAGGINADFKNWDLPVPDNTTVNSTINYGTGGFMPFGFDGVIKGAATCFYGFVGFDCIATTGEEVRNPKKAIPRSIFWSLLIIMIAYVGTSAIVTLMVPYYLQDVNAPIPHAFKEIGWIGPMWVVAVGGMFGLAASLFGAMFPLPRILYAMASDGLIFKFLGFVSPRFSTPVIGTILAGILTGLMGGLFDLKQLVNMMSIGTLLAYTIVAACVLLLRYSTVDASRVVNEGDDESEEIVPTSREIVTARKLLMQLFNTKKLQAPNKISELLIAIEIFLFCFLSLALSLMYIHLIDYLKNNEIWAIILISCTGLLTMLVLVSMATQPSVLRTDIFQVPWVPLFPALSILVNIYLMLMLDVNTWIRFGIWMAIGLPIYFFFIYFYKSKIPDKKLPVTNIKNGTLYHENKPNGIIQNGIDNGIDNIAFVTELVSDEPKVKLIGEIQQNASTGEEINHIDRNDLEQIDLEMENYEIKIKNSFEKEEDVQNSLDEVLADLDDTLSKEDSRKISLDTVSNESSAFVEKSVVALVHCEDVVSTPVSPSSEFPPSFSSNFEDNISNTLSHNLEFIERSKHSLSKGFNSEINHSENEDNEPYLGDVRHNAINNFTISIPTPPPMENFNGVRNSNFVKDDVKLEAKEIDKEPSQDISGTLENKSLPPPPPPIADFEAYVLSTTIRKIPSAPNLHIPAIPPPDYSPQNSPISLSRQSSKINMQDEIEDGETENVMTGSERYENIKAKLTRIFSTKSVPIRLTKPANVERDVPAHQTASHVPILEEFKAKHVSMTMEEIAKEQSGEEDKGVEKITEENIASKILEENNEQKNNNENTGHNFNKDVKTDSRPSNEHIDSKEKDKEIISSGSDYKPDEEQPLKPADIKMKLEALFKTQPRPKQVGAQRPTFATMPRHKDAQNDTKIFGDNEHLKENRSSIVRNMAFKLNGINSSSENSYNKNSNSDSQVVSAHKSTDPDTSQVKHKNLMANTFASIRLRKVDSFKLT